MIGLVTIPGSYAIDALAAAGGLPLAAVETAPLGLLGSWHEIDRR